MIYPTKETVEIYKQTYDRVPLYKKLPLNDETIISLYERFRGPYTFLLESGDQSNFGRYSIIGLQTNKRFVSINNTTTYYDNKKLKTFETNGFDSLKEIMKKSSPIYPELSVFTGGAIGHFNYDLIRLFENIPDNNIDDLKVPLMNFGLVDQLIVIDNLINEMFIVSNIDDIEEYEIAVDRINEIEKKIKTSKPSFKKTEIITSKVESNVSEYEFIEMVNKAKNYITQGDIFQVVLSQRFGCDYKGDPFMAYLKLRDKTISPYMYYLDFDEYVVAGVSPEMLLECRGKTIKTMPIAGTRKRGKDSTEDNFLIKSLINDEKEIAEHMMLVDLGRNDIGKVSKIGSVKVNNLKDVKLYSHVMHMTTEVTGKLDNNKTAFDAFASLLPAGTLSGAPKIRAMEIIDELENIKRGVYGGAIGFIGYNGQFDTCITIRTFIFKDSKVYVQAGAGIVKDSVPINEYRECFQKAAALLSAINKEATL